MSEFLGKGILQRRTEIVFDIIYRRDRAFRGQDAFVVTRILVTTRKRMHFPVARHLAFLSPEEAEEEYRA